jgi:hypothetical protein
MRFQSSVLASIGLPPPVVSGGFQTFTDSVGDIWIAKPGVNGGGWERPANVLHAYWYRNTAWQTPAVANTIAQFSMNVNYSDPYGLFNGNTFTAPISGIYQMNLSLGIVAGAVGQSLYAVITNTGLGALAYGMAFAPGATFIVAAVNYTTPVPVGGQWMTAQQSGTVGLTGRASSDMTRVTIDYLGTG